MGVSSTLTNCGVGPFHDKNLILPSHFILTWYIYTYTNIGAKSCEICPQTKLRQNFEIGTSHKRSEPCISIYMYLLANKQNFKSFPHHLFMI